MVATSSTSNTTLRQLFFEVDLSPPILSITQPSDTIYNSNEVEFAYTTDEVSSISIYHNDVANTTAMDPGFLLSNLMEGSHNITIVATDVFGHSSSQEILFEIDTTNPSVSARETLEIIAGSTGSTLQFSATDINPDTYVLFQNNSEVDSGSWSSSSNVTYNIDGLSVGTYNFTIVLSDTANNAISATTEVKVVSSDTDNDENSSDDSSSDNDDPSDSSNEDSPFPAAILWVSIVILPVLTKITNRST